MRISDWSSDVCSSDLWLERREQPDWSDDDRATLDAWLDASIAHKLAYWRLEHGWTKVGRLAALRQVPPPGHLPLRRQLRLWKPEIGRASCRERVCQYV